MHRAKKTPMKRQLIVAGGGEYGLSSTDIAESLIDMLWLRSEGTFNPVAFSVSKWLCKALESAEENMAASNNDREMCLKVPQRRLDGKATTIYKDLTRLPFTVMIPEI
jgi:hypothetical protein